MLRFTHLVNGELGSEPRAHYVSITSCPSGVEQPWEREQLPSHDLHSEENTTLLTLAWECISNFPNLPTPLARRFLATFDSLPTRPLGNAEDKPHTVSLATSSSFSTSSLSTPPLSSGLPPFLTTTTGRQWLMLIWCLQHPRAVLGSVIMAKAELWTWVHCRDPPPMRTWCSRGRCHSLPASSGTLLAGESHLTQGSFLFPRPPTLQ